MRARCVAARPEGRRQLPQQPRSEGTATGVALGCESVHGFSLNARGVCELISTIANGGWRRVMQETDSDLMQLDPLLFGHGRRVPRAARRRPGALNDEPGEGRGFGPWTPAMRDINGLLGPGRRLHAHRGTQRSRTAARRSRQAVRSTTWDPTDHKLCGGCSSPTSRSDACSGGSRVRGEVSAQYRRRPRGRQRDLVAT